MQNTLMQNVLQHKIFPPLSRRLFSLTRSILAISFSLFFFLSSDADGLVTGQLGHHYPFVRALECWPVLPRRGRATTWLTSGGGIPFGLYLLTSPRAKLQANGTHSSVFQKEWLVVYIGVTPDSDSIFIHCSLRPAVDTYKGVPFCFPCYHSEFAKKQTKQTQ